MRSPQLFFPPPPPFPPEYEDKVNTATNTSYDLNDDELCPSDKNNNQSDLLDGNNKHSKSEFNTGEDKEDLFEVFSQDSQKDKYNDPLILGQASTISGL